MKAPSHSALDLRRFILDAGGSPPAVKPIVDIGRLINRGQADRKALQPVCDAIYGKGEIDADELVLDQPPTAEFKHEIDGTVVSVELLEPAGLLARNVRWTYPDGYIASGVSGSHDCAGVPKPWRIECAIEASGGRWTDVHTVVDAEALEVAEVTEPSGPVEVDMAEVLATVKSAKAYVDKHPEHAAQVLADEKEGQARKSLVAHLGKVLADQEGVTA